jgi:NADPH-dependent curcumin reductase CurA
MPGSTSSASRSRARRLSSPLQAALSAPLSGSSPRWPAARAVGIAGGAEKCRYVAEELRFDSAVDHRARDFPKKLAAACPKGIDVYFENVGGAVWQAVLPLLNTFARVPVCGLIAQYSAAGQAAGPNLLPATMREVLSKSLTLRGFINYEFAAEHYSDFLRIVSSAIADGRVRYREDITDGLENAPAAFIGMLEGRNFGKTLVRVARSN